MGLMKIYTAILLLVFSAPIYAETFLCLGEAGAGTTYNSKTRSFESSTYDVSNQKFILSSKDGKWTFKRFEDKLPLLECPSEFYCSPPNGLVGPHFFKSKENVFAYYFINSSADGIEDSALVVSGFCSST